MSSLAIECHNLGKKFRIGALKSRHRTLRESLSSAASAPLRRVRQGRKGGAQQAHGTHWALRNVSFQVKEGEVVGIIGRNGAGKSTLLKILSRITDPTEGWADLYGRVGSLLEVGTGFHQELSGRENVYLNGAIIGMTKGEIERKFEEIVAFSEVERFIDTPVKHYSSGMQLRLAFAVAAHLEPEILIMDEVLAVGDAAFQKKCLGKMGSVAQQGRTVLFVSHNISAVRDLCTRAIWVDKGEVVADGDVHDVIAAYMNSMSSSEFTYTDKVSGLTVERVRLRNSYGEVASTFAPGEEMSVEIVYHAERPVPLPYFALVIGGVHGPCFIASMLLDGFRPSELKGSGVLSCRFPQLPLLPQTYSLRLQISESSALRSILPFNDVCSFDVSGRLADYGFPGNFYQSASRTASAVVPYQWLLPDGSSRIFEFKESELPVGPFAPNGNSSSVIAR